AGMVAYVVVAAKLKPELVGETHASRLAARPLGADVTSAPTAPTGDEESIHAMLASTMLVILLILGTLGAIWLGLCTPTEGAGVGAVRRLPAAVLHGVTPTDVCAG